MIDRAIKAAIFGATFSVVMLISNKMKPVSSTPLWLEAIVRFLVATVVDFVVLLTVDLFRQKRKGSGKHEA